MHRQKALLTLPVALLTGALMIPSRQAGVAQTKTGTDPHDLGPILFITNRPGIRSDRACIRVVDLLASLVKGSHKLLAV